MTLEAWVQPSAVNSVWRDVIYKGRDNYYLEGMSDHNSVPDAGGTFNATSGDVFGDGPGRQHLDPPRGNV